MKVDVAGRIDQIQFILLTVQRVIDGNGPCLDRNASFPFDLEVVENLLTELPLRDGTALQQQLVCESAFAMVNVGNNRKIANKPLIKHGSSKQEGMCLAGIARRRRRVDVHSSRPNTGSPDSIGKPAQPE